MSNQMDKNLENLVNIVDFSKEVFGSERDIIDAEISQVRYRRYGQKIPCTEFRYNPTDNDVIAPKFNGGFAFAKNAIKAYKHSLSKPGIQFKFEYQLDENDEYYRQASKKGTVSKPLTVRVSTPDDRDLRVVKTTFAEDAKKYTIIRTKNK